MASDDPTGDGQGVKGMSVDITMTDHDEAAGSSTGWTTGEIGMLLDATFWSPLFGSCTDRFGVSWMVDVDAGETA